MGQATHTPPSEYWPTGQVFTTPLIHPYPAVHVAHVLEPATLVVPLAHVAHEVAPGELAKVPAVHCVQETALPVLNVPELHAVSVLLVQNEPAEHD